MTHPLRVLLLCLALEATAFAQGSDDSAENLFARARALMKSGDCGRALPLLEQSHALEPSIGARFNMAICEARLGKLTRAADHLRSVLDDCAPGDDRRPHAEHALQELLPRIPRLFIEFDAEQHELESATLDGEELARSHLNQPLPIDPGRHELRVLLRGAPPHLHRFSVNERELYTWSLHGARDRPGIGTEPAPLSSAHAGPETDQHAQRAETLFQWTTRRTAAVVGGGAAVVAFGIATGFGISARSTYDSAQPHCPEGDRCRPEGIEIRDQARDQGRIATVAFTLGIAATAAAATLWFTGAPRSMERAKLRVGLRTDTSVRMPRGGTILFEGSY